MAKLLLRRHAGRTETTRAACSVVKAFDRLNRYLQNRRDNHLGNAHAARNFKIFITEIDKNNFDLEDSTTWENDLSSEPVKARKTRVQHEVEGNEESQYGAYAYWVGDEGVKTKVSVQNPFKPDFDPKPTDKRNTSQIQKDNLAVATEPNLTFSVNSGSLLSGFGIDWEEATTEKDSVSNEGEKQTVSS